MRIRHSIALVPTNSATMRLEDLEGMMHAASSQWRGSRGDAGRSHIRIASEPTAIRRDPGVDSGPDPSRTREVEQREQRPHQRAFPERSPEGEEPARHASVRRDGEHGIVEVGVQQLWKRRVDLRPCVRVMKSERTAHIERAADPECPHTESALSVVDHIQHLLAFWAAPLRSTMTLAVHATMMGNVTISAPEPTPDRRERTSEAPTPWADRQTPGPQFLEHRGCVVAVDERLVKHQNNLSRRGAALNRELLARRHCHDVTLIVGHVQRWVNLPFGMSRASGQWSKATSCPQNPMRSRYIYGRCPFGSRLKGGRQGGRGSSRLSLYYSWLHLALRIPSLLNLRSGSGCGGETGLPHSDVHSLSVGSAL